MKKSAIVICALISMWTAGPVLASTNLGAGPVRGTTLVEKPVAATTAGTERAAQTMSYAEREKAAPELANLKGGDSAGIYIGGSTLAIVLLIVILIILL